MMVANRINPARRNWRGSDIEKLFNCPVNSRIPNDYFSLHRAVTLGQPVDGHCELGKSDREAWRDACRSIPVQDKKKVGPIRFRGYFRQFSEQKSCFRILKQNRRRHK